MENPFFIHEKTRILSNGFPFYGQETACQKSNFTLMRPKMCIFMNLPMENTGFPHRFSKAVFEAAQGRKPLFHGFHMPYYY